MIGSNLVNHLKKNHHVIGLNRNPDDNAHESYCVDLSNCSEASRILTRLNGDLFIHCAAIANPQPTPENLNRFIDVNIKSAFNISQYIKCPIINLSSIVVYGKFDWSHKKNEEDPTNPISLYGVTKLAAENIFNLYSTVIHLRMGTIVGPNLTHGLVKDICERLKNQERFYVYGKKPGSVKPFLHVSDLIKAVDVLVNNLDSWKEDKQVFNTFNIVNNDNISVEEVALACMSALGIEKPIEWDESKVWHGDNQIINASNDNAKLSLSWTPQYTSYDAIMKAVIENNYTEK